MKKAAAITSACMLTFALNACSDSNYVIHTSDGRSIIANGKPQIDNEAGMISYKGANGNKQQINRIDVKEMIELEQQWPVDHRRDVNKKETPQFGDATLIAMDRQGKCTGSEKGQPCYHGLDRRPIANTTTQHHNRKPKAHQNTHPDKAFRPGFRKCRHYRYLLIEP